MIAPAFSSGDLLWAQVSKRRLPQKRDEHGSTLQFFADPNELESCYENSTSLLWRDSGALATAISFVAAASGLSSVVLGRIGTNIIRFSGLEVPFLGFGAVHIGTPINRPTHTEGL